MTIGERIKKARENKNIDRKDLALYLQKDVSTLSKIERNLQIPSAEIVANICNYLEVDANYILLGKSFTIPQMDHRYQMLSEEDKEQIEYLLQRAERKHNEKYNKVGNL